ncbi:MAG: flagellar assembly protein FliW [Desulfobulbaceae bacterium]|nr:flagellar assembly protein FliW [Desulfobulbaceae bacterium]
MTEAMAEKATTTASGASQPATMMTAKFGEITIDPEKIITMTTPFLGFPESSRFVLRPHGEKSPFIWLQSLDNPDLAFVMINPTLLIPAYCPEIPPMVLDELEVNEQQQLELLVILAIPHGRIEEMTANLLGPVAINPMKRIAKQVPLDPTRYDPCWQVLVEDEQANP